MTLNLLLSDRTIKIHENPDAKIHFTPEKLVLKGNTVEGKIRLINEPQIETNSFMYRTLIAGWKIFLGGAIPNQVLPEGVRVEGQYVYYQFPKAQLRILDALFQNLEDDSALNLNLKEGQLQIDSDVSISWSDLNLQMLLEIFNSSSI